jgi:hypothetical protein
MQTNSRRALAGAGIFAAVVCGVAYFALPSDREVAERITELAEAKLGVRVTLGKVHWSLLPRPSIEIEDAATVQPEPISFKRLVAHPRLAELVRRKLVFKDLTIDGGVMPQLSLRGLKVQPGPSGAANPKAVVETLTFRDLTWVTRFGNRLEFDGTAQFDAGWRPRTAVLTRPGVTPATQLTLTRQGDEDRWQAQIQVGGGTADGQLELKGQDGGGMELSGELAPRNIEVESAMQAFKRHSAVRGRASGKTLLSASGKNLGELARSLHTRTTFSMTPATLVRLDVDKAIRTFGKDRSGQTQLKTLTGQMDTQNSADGMKVSYSNLQARGETFSAAGGGTIFKRQIEGEVKVDIAGGLVGVPLKLSGSLDAPQVTVPASAMAGATAGAVVGTAVLPGIGTAIGAAIGATMGNLFGGRKDTDPPKR